MRNADISPCFSDLLHDLKKAPERTLFEGDIKNAIAGLEHNYTNTGDLIEAVQQAVRMVTARHAGLLNNHGFREGMDQHKPKSWKDYTPLKTDIPKQEELGKRLFNIPQGFENPFAVVIIGEGANHIARPLIERLKDERIPFLIRVADETFMRLVLNHIDDAGMKSYGAWYLRMNEPVTHRCVAMPNATAASPVPDNKERAKQFSKIIEPIAKRGLSGQVMFTLTYFPTEIDAEIDGIPYDDYLNLYFEMCDQPDKWIEAANEVLITKLENASTVRFANKEGTDISMSLIDTDGRHFTFANSQTKKNIPGSEVFSAPRRDSINGKIVSKGRFMPKGSKDSLIEDLTMVFKDGQIVEFDAAKGRENFEEFLNRHPNNRYVGELGIGTNPHLKRHVANGLLVEKVSSSFHLALGEAYQITNYLGKDVHMNNGNDSIDHWDITTMLGDIYLDGEIIMKDGLFLDPALDVLNRGWDAVPMEDRPARWKIYKGAYKD